MKGWFFSLNGALTLSVLTLLSQVWRGFLDAMFVYPTDFGDEAMMQLAAIIYTLLFAGWAWAILAARRGSRRGLIATFVINGLILVVIPISTLLVYCPFDCLAENGVFLLVNTLNLVLGLAAGLALALQLWRKPQPVTE